MSAILLERDVAVAMGDGIVTRADVWRSPSDPPGPAILVRTPYLKENMAPSVQIDPRAATSRGYAVVVQDVRGTGTSGGRFEPFVNEPDDGAATIAWVRDQAWCDGRVVMLGMSYVGATQWMAATRRPDGLLGVAPTLSASSFGEGWTSTNGVRELGFVTSWSAANLANVDDRWLDDVGRAYRDHDALAAIAPWTVDWLALGADDPYWEARAADDVDPDLPAFIVAGWYDIFCSASISCFQRRFHPSDRLVIGPWAHDPELSHLVGDCNVGVAGAGAAWGFATNVLDWFDAVLAGRRPSRSKVTAYLLGARRWVDLDAWPPSGAEPAMLALTGSGCFDVDVADLPPTVGGRGLQVLVPGWGFGVRDQRALAAHPGTLSLELDPLPRPQTWAGPVTVRIPVSACGGDVRQWTATLCQRRADGSLHNLAEGVADAPVTAASVDVPLGHVFVALHRDESLVVIVGGGSFPRWAPPTEDGRQVVGAGAELFVTRLETE